MVSILQAVDVAASKQWSLITRQQLLDSGVSAERVAGLLRSGVFRRAGYRVYATVGSPRSWEQSVLAAVLSAGPGAVASHASAARLWGFSYLPEAGLDVTILVDAESSFGRRRPGLHRTRVLPDADIDRRLEIPCTTFERTLCDCTTRLSAFQLGRVLDDGLRRNLASLDRLMKCVVRLDSGPGRRLLIAKELLAKRDGSFDPGGSASELRVLAVLREAGVPAPVQQFRVRVGSRSFELDFAWPDRRVLAEYYGLAVHSGASAVAHDNSRLTALAAVGWKPLVFTDASSDQEIVERVRQALADNQSDW
jgi:hypothetical protein